MAEQQATAEEDLSEEQAKLADLCSSVIDTALPLNIEMATVTRDLEDGTPAAACIVCLGGPEKTLQVLNVLAELEAEWEDEAMDGEG